MDYHLDNLHSLDTHSLDTHLEEENGLYAIRNQSPFTVKGIGESYLKDENEDYRIGKEYGITTAADIISSDIDDLHLDDYKKDFEDDSYDTSENIKKIRESSMEVEGKRYKTQEQLDRLTKGCLIKGVKDFMEDFEDQEEYYEDDYDYGEGLASSHRVRSDSILDLHFSDESAHLRQRESSDTILNIDYMDDVDKSDKGLRVLSLAKDLSFGDSPLRMDYDYKDEISDYESEIVRGQPSVLTSRKLGINGRFRSVIRPGASFDHGYCTIDPYTRAVRRLGSRNRLEHIRNCIFLKDPSRRVMSSDAVWLSSSPIRGKKYRSYDEMMKRRHIVRFK